MLEGCIKNANIDLNVPKKKERDLSLDLVRIFSMSMICVSHYILYSDVIPQSNGAEKVILSVIYAVASSVVNTFVILSGFLLFNKRFKLESLFKLWLEIIFVGAASILIGKFWGIEIGVKQLALAFAPLSVGSYWFINVYVVLYMIHGLIDKALDSLSYKQFTFCVLAQIFFICCVCSLNPFINAERFIGNSLGSILLFVLLYSVGCYLKKYSHNVFETKAFYIFSIVSLVCLSIILCTQYVFPKKMDLISSYSLFRVVISIFTFLCIRKIKLKKKAAFISFMAQAAIAVYLFQESEIIKPILWKYFDAAKYSGSYRIFTYMALSVIVIWLASIMIHQIFSFFYKKVLQQGVRKLSFVEKLWTND